MPQGGTRIRFGQMLSASPKKRDPETSGGARHAYYTSERRSKTDRMIRDGREQLSVEMRRVNSNQTGVRRGSAPVVRLE